MTTCADRLAIALDQLAEYRAAATQDGIMRRELIEERDRLRAENEKLWDVITFLEDHEPNLVSDAIEKNGLRKE